MKRTHLVATALCLSFAGLANAQGIWIQHSVTGPSARFGHAMAFDSARGEAILFGGDTSSDTWAWNGTSWNLRSQLGPSPRSEHAMAYDSARGRVVLFGGMTSAGEVGDTWEWDGATWIPMLFVAGPTPRSMHAMAYASTLQRTILFGGGSGTTDLDDTWTWSGTAWVNIPTSAPPRRCDHSMYVDSRSQRVLITGGRQRISLSGTYWIGSGPGVFWISVPWSFTWDQSQLDSWEFDGSIWNASTSLITPRHGAVSVLDPLRQIALLHGGISNQANFSPGNPGIQGQQQGTPPSLTQNLTNLPSTDASWGHATNWITLSNIGPQISHHAAAFDAARGETVMFGGRSANGSPQGSTWTWQGSPGTSVAYGTGCGSPPLTLSPTSNSHPTIRGTASLDVLNNPTVLAYVLIGFSKTSFGTFTLPLPLGGYGLTGCLLHQSSEIGSIALNPSTPGTARFDLTLPNWSGLIGLKLFVQSWAHAPGQNLGNTVASNGVEWTIGY